MLKVSLAIKTFVSGKVVAVDGSCVGHKTSSIACSMEIAKDEQNIEVCTFKYDPLAHAAAVVSWLVYLSRKVKGIIVVFDGPDPPGKADVREARDQDKADAQVIVDDVSASPSSRFAAFKKTVRWGQETIDAIKKELTMYAVPWVQAPAEADAQMALLVREGYATVINTNDFDAISMCPDTPVWDTYSRGCNQQNFGRIYMPEGVEAIHVEVRNETGTPHEDDGTHLHDLAEDDDEEGDDEPAVKRAKVAHHFAEVREKGLLWVASVISGCDYSPGIQGYGYARALGKVAESPLTKKSTLSDVVAFIDGFSSLEEDVIKKAYLSMHCQTVLVVNMDSAEESQCERLTPVPAGLSGLIESSCGSAASAGLSLLGFCVPVDAHNVPLHILGLDKVGLTSLLVENGYSADELGPMDIGDLQTLFGGLSGGNGFTPLTTPARAKAQVDERRKILSLEVVEKVRSPDSRSATPAKFDRNDAETLFMNPQKWMEGSMTVACPKSFLKGLSKLEAGDVETFTWGTVKGNADGDELVRCAVRSSVQNKNYEVVFRIKTRAKFGSKQRVFVGVSDFFCECRPGLGVCKHLGAAVLKHAEFSTIANEDIAATSKTCMWRDRGARAPITEEEAFKIRQDRTPAAFTVAKKVSLLVINGGKRPTKKKMRAMMVETNKERNKNKRKFESNNPSKVKQSLNKVKEELSKTDQRRPRELKRKK
jgi:5'-3' exonuclease